MKVSDLIQELSKCNADAEVFYRYSNRYNDSEGNTVGFYTEHDINNIDKTSDSDKVYIMTF